MEKRDIYQEVTNTIVGYLESGTSANGWEMPWHATGLDMPRNASTGKRYRGVNVLALWAARARGDYATGMWATYKQWSAMGAQVRKGERGAAVVFWQFLEKPDATKPGKVKKIPLLRHYTVFNAAQVDGYTAALAPTVSLAERVASAESIVARSGARITYGGERAFYRPSTDDVHMPAIEQFVPTKTGTATESFYSTLFHELTHWTGHATRCERDLSGRFGGESYAAEELVAELGAAFMCASLGLSAAPRVDHAQYIASWLRVLRDDKRAIFTAAKLAQAAHDFLNPADEASDDADGDATPDATPEPLPLAA